MPVLRSPDMDNIRLKGMNLLGKQSFQGGIIDMGLRLGEQKIPEL